MSDAIDRARRKAAEKALKQAIDRNMEIELDAEARRIVRRYIKENREALSARIEADLADAIEKGIPKLIKKCVEGVYLGW